MPRRRRPQPRLVLTAVCAIGCAFALGQPRSASAFGEVVGDATRPPPRELSALEASVDEIESLVAGAHFRTAIGVAERTREWADEIPRSPEAQEVRARLEVLLSTSQVALGDEAGARRSMERAVYVWPLLILDETTTSPRVVRLFRAVRGDGGVARARP